MRHSGHINLNVRDHYELLIFHVLVTINVSLHKYSIIINELENLCFEFCEKESQMFLFCFIISLKGFLGSVYTCDYFLMHTCKCLYFLACSPSSKLIESQMS